MSRNFRKSSSTPPYLHSVNQYDETDQTSSETLSLPAFDVTRSFNMQYFVIVRL